MMMMMMMTAPAADTTARYNLGYNR